MRRRLVRHARARRAQERSLGRAHPPTHQFQIQWRDGRRCAQRHSISAHPEWGPGRARRECRCPGMLQGRALGGWTSRHSRGPADASGSCAARRPAGACMAFQSHRPRTAIAPLHTSKSSGGGEPSTPIRALPPRRDAGRGNAAAPHERLAPAAPATECDGTPAPPAAPSRSSVHAHRRRSCISANSCKRD